MKHNMNLKTKPYCEQVREWPESGRHILAQFDDETIIVYQAYRPQIGRFASEHGYFGGEFSYSRMSWIKPNFLWMMYHGWSWAGWYDPRPHDDPRDTSLFPRLLRPKRSPGAAVGVIGSV